MTRPQRIACIVASALAGIATGTMTASRPASPALMPSGGTITTKAVSPSEPAASSSKRSDTSSSPIPAMPDAGMPLARTYSALATRAEAGDREAAERLIKEIDACRDLPELTRYAIEDALRIRKDQRITEGPAAPEAAADLASFEARSGEVAATIDARTLLCAGIGDHRLGELGHWLYKAGELDDAKAAHRFGSGSWISVDPGDAIDDGAIEFWRAHALEMTEHALAGGELSASVELAVSFYDIPGLAYVSDDGGVSYLHAVLPRDPVRAAAYLRVADMTGVCQGCTTYAMQMEYAAGGTAAADARAEAERICTTDLAGRCEHMPELLAR